MPGLWILNFGHPLTSEQKKQIRALSGQRISKVLELKCQFDHQRSFVEQARELIDSLGLSRAQWQTLALLVNPPSLASIACVVLAELHGRSGHFPPIMRLRPTSDTPPRFEVAEIIDLHKIREEAREARFE